jgi:WD40 repeat protein
VTTVGFHPLARVLATNGGRFSVASFWEWDTDSGLTPIEVHPWSDRRAALASGQVGAAFALAFRPGTAALATGHIRGTARLWDVHRPARPLELGQLQVRAAYVDALAYSPDGSLLAVADHLGYVDVWRYPTPSDPSPAHTVTVATGRASYLAFSHDDRYLAAVTFLDVAVWDTASASTEPAARLARGPGVRTGMARALAFHPWLPVLVCGDAQGAVSLWDLSDLGQPQLVSVTPVHHRPVSTLSFHPSGDLLAVGCRDGLTALWTFTGA